MRAAGASLNEIHKATALYNSLNSYTTFFSNRLYIGTLEFGDLVIENYCDPIIDRETWDAVQRRVQAHAAHRDLMDPGSRSHPRRAGSRYLLSGLAYCARCGSPLYGLTAPRYDRYACTRSHRRRDCDLRPIPRLVLEDAVINTLREYVLQPEVQLANQQLIQTQQADRLKKSANSAQTYQSAWLPSAVSYRTPPRPSPRAVIPRPCLKTSPAWKPKPPS